MNSRLLEENIYHFVLLELTVGIPTPETNGRGQSFTQFILTAGLF